MSKELARLSSHKNNHTLCRKVVASRALINVFLPGSPQAGCCLVDHGPVIGRFAAKGLLILMKRKQKNTALQNH